MDSDMLKQLENELTNITPDFRHTLLYKILKDKLTAAGYWKAKQRGNPIKGYKIMQEKLNKYE